MRFALSLILLATSTSAIAAPDWDAKYPANCDYFNTTTDQSITARCTERWGVDNDKIVAEITLPGKRFFLEQIESQGQWGTYKLNGKPAVRYEIDRETYRYATLDLTEFLELGH